MVVAGGGVAAVEALLALRNLAADLVEVVLVAPGPDFTPQPLSVATPFGAAEPQRIPLAKIAADAGAEYRPGSFAGIDYTRRVVLTGDGDLLPFDAALLAIGATRLNGVPGALTYRGAVDNDDFQAGLKRAELGAIRHLAFLVPESVRWPLAIYDLALLSATHLRRRGSDAGASLITHESAPLGLFGERGSAAVRSRLEAAGVALRTSTKALGFEAGAIALERGAAIPADWAVSLPTLRVPGLIGIPQGPHGFIGTDGRMRVENRPRVYATGDATWFPIKQGGVATQQADVAARAIAALAGAEVTPSEFKPVLRAALLTGEHPLYLRTVIGERDAGSAVSDEPLWWPPSKIAGTHLAGYLRGEPRDAARGSLEDLPAEASDPGAEEYEDTVALALRAADLDAADHDLRGALRWLQVAEDLDITLPAPYADRRRRWRRELEAEPQRLAG